MIHGSKTLTSTRITSIVVHVVTRQFAYDAAEEAVNIMIESVCALPLAHYSGLLSRQLVFPTLTYTRTGAY